MFALDLCVCVHVGGVFGGIIAGWLSDLYVRFRLRVFTSIDVGMECEEWCRL